MACAEPQGEGSHALVRDSLGIPIIVNAGPASDTVRFDSADVTIGGIDVSEAYTFRELYDLGVLRDGGVVVADIGSRVAQFDVSGEWVRDFGQPGAGPGEFRQPRFVQVAGDTVFVWDIRPPRLSAFSMAGTFLDLVRVQKRSVGLPVRRLGSWWLDEQEWGQTSDTAAAQAMIVRWSAANVVDTLKGPYPVPEFGWEILNERTRVGAMVMPPVFSVRPQWAVCNDMLWWADARQPRIEELGPDGVVQRIIELARPIRPIAPSDRDAHITAMAARWGLSDETIARMHRETTFTAEAPRTGAIVCGVGGAVWINRFDPAVAEAVDAVGPIWDVTDETGVVVRRVEFPDGFVLKAVTTDRAYGLARRELDVSVVEIYDVPPGWQRQPGAA